MALKGGGGVNPLDLNLVKRIYNTYGGGLFFSRGDFSLEGGRTLFQIIILRDAVRIGAKNGDNFKLI